MFKNNRKGQLGIIGILFTILLFEILGAWVIISVTGENVKNVFVSNCDCGLGGCATYVTLNGANALFDKCESQVNSKPVLKDALNNQFFTNGIVTILFIVINLIIIFIAILIIRGVPA